MRDPIDPVRVAIIGFGKIARDQHAAAIARHPGLVLVATIDPVGLAQPGLPHFPALQAARDHGVAIDAVAVCTPPQSRFAVAEQALHCGWHVLAEKPPCATLAECDRLAALAQRADRTLFAAWHSRFAPGVAAARGWLAGRHIARVEIEWKESIRKWHPGQLWIGQDGGLGVFDPAINALSMLTALIDTPVAVRHAALNRPANWAMPISGMVACVAGETAITLDLDFDHAGAEVWDMRFTAANGETLALQRGGHAMSINGVAVELPAASEYDGVYARFAALIAARAHDFDVTPLRVAIDATMRFPMTAVAIFTA